MKAYVVVGLGFGDEGKGAVVDALVRERKASLVVRYNGGAQAGHNVVDHDQDGGRRHHCFAQFGAGTFAGTKTLLSKYMLVNPIFLHAEAKHLKYLGVDSVYEHLVIDRHAMITTPYHVAMNRLRELVRDKDRHGSCGMGIGETVDHAERHPEHVIRAGDLDSEPRLRWKLGAQRDYFNTAASELLKPVDWVKNTAMSLELSIICANETIERAVVAFMALADRAMFVDDTWTIGALKKWNVVFEGAQGILLDQDFGFHPNTTWTTTTTKNADAILKDGCFDGEVTRLGLIRAYHTRHGAGPFPTEDVRVLAPHDHNAHDEDGNTKVGDWQGGFRCGFLDNVLLRYALEANVASCKKPIDGLVMTCLDHLDNKRTTQPCALGYDTGLRSTYHIPVEARPTLAKQEEITKFLQHARPLYTLLDKKDAFGLDYARQAAEKLGVPLRGASFGRNVFQKAWL